MLQNDCTLLKPSALITQFPWPSLVGLKVLDLACGSGRNGLWFLAQGADVTFIDRELSALHIEHSNAHKLQWDLEANSAPLLPVEAFDIVLVFNYLHRPLLTQITASVKSKGFIVYETFTWRQAEIGRPRNPDFLLTENELKSAFANWQPLHYFEGQLSEPHLEHVSFKAQLIAQKW
ncbi:methyltransferase domain-containing protein [Shewanella profunda]|uniref:class I SAM-dependent methyltransferase n=1 Tax=Shewanella profunda TaxID=254793 RepID=UPI00200F5D75|nr:methyltransferase domain-containing protein [Shewanella profunda]MCL1088212.1 methyltransferase domain-containing protein [Shewanella profunda]